MSVTIPLTPVPPEVRMPPGPSPAPPDLTWSRSARPTRCPFCATDARATPCRHALGRHLTEEVALLVQRGHRVTAQGYLGQPQLAGAWWLFDHEVEGRPRPS